MKMVQSEMEKVIFKENFYCGHQTSTGTKCLSMAKFSCHFPYKFSLFLEKTSELHFLICLHSYWAKLFYALRQWTPRNIWLILRHLIFVFKIGLDARTAEDVSSVYIPKTVSLLRSYLSLQWILEQTVTPTPSSAMYVCYTETRFVQLFLDNEDASLLFKPVTCIVHVCVFVKWGTIPNVLPLFHKEIWS